MKDPSGFKNVATIRIFSELAKLKKRGEDTSWQPTRFRLPKAKPSGAMEENLVWYDPEDKKIHIWDSAAGKEYVSAAFTAVG